jgi:hypothetical protein
MPSFKAHHTASKPVAFHGKSDDLRRAYEFLGRIDILESSLSGASFCDVSTLVGLALNELAAGRDREACDLLRSAEHISFAAQAPNGYASSAMHMFDELRQAIDAEFSGLIRRAEVLREERSSPRHGQLPDLCARTLKDAREAYAEQAFGRALELARAAALLANLAAQMAYRNSLEHRIAS